MNNAAETNRNGVPAIKEPVELRCEYTENPLGLDILRPRFSWILRHGERNIVQTAYQILVAGSGEALLADNGDVWDSGKVVSEESGNIEYDGSPLESGRTYYWRVRWWDNAGRVSPYSRAASFETGLLNSDDWQAQWIAGGDLLRASFKIGRPVRRARAYICGLGYYELRMNGSKIGDRVLDPGWTDYDRLVLYTTYDVTTALAEGENAVGVMLGNGRYTHKEYSPSIPAFRKFEQAVPKVILQLNLEFQDGSRDTFVTDTGWKVSAGPVTVNDLYDGETYDARLERDGWDLPGYDDTGWVKAAVVSPPGGQLVSQATLPPIKAVGIIPPVSLSNPQAGVYVYDLGRNFAGWVRLKVSGPGGSEVKLRHAELLDPAGMINQKTLDQAAATDIYILKGEGVETYEPRFTYHGFRYVEVTGFPGTPNLDNLEGVEVHSAVTPAGGFQCSNGLINSIHRNVYRGQLNNLMSIPTDCCQRSERMGWLGDAQLVAEEAILNFDMAAFYTKWVRDIKASQRQDGCLPNVVPPYWDIYPADPAWGTACIVVPWYVYRYYGDRRILEENYPVMKGWVDYLTARSENNLVKESQFGDWCAPGTDRPLDSTKELVAAWCYYRDVLVLARIAGILGKADEAEEYARLSEKVKQAFNREFIREERHFMDPERTFFIYGTGSQTCHILPLYADMVPEDKKEAILQYLLEDIIKTHASHLNTGIVGTRYALDTLSKYGYDDLAFRLITQTTYPSLGYMIREGATTLWERWEYLDDAGINSHNHIMFGAVDTWFYRTLAGIVIDPLSPAFRKIIIKPHVTGDITHVSASLNTICGMVASSWRKTNDSLTLDVVVPVNSRASVSIPVLDFASPVIRESCELIYRNGDMVKDVAGVGSVTKEKDYITFQVGSGSYSFRIEKSV